MRTLFQKTLPAILLVFFFETVSAVEIKNPLDAVVALGHEMSEMRHMLEIYAMIGTGVSFHLPKEQMKKSIRQYEETITAIEKKIPDTVVQNQITQGRTAWGSVKQALMTSLQSVKPSAEAMRKEAVFIHGNIRKVIRAMETMKTHLLAQTKFKAINELNAALEIDASARRLSAHYAMWMWNLPDPTIEAHWQNGMKIYAHSLDILSASSLNANSEFHQNLTTARQQLQSFSMMHKMALDKRFTPALAQMRAAAASDAAMNMSEIILKQK